MTQVLLSATRIEYVGFIHGERVSK